MPAATLVVKSVVCVQNHTLQRSEASCLHRRRLPGGGGYVATDCWCCSNCSPLGGSALSLAGQGVHCQELTGVITGQVVDQTDNVLPGARVVITNLHSARIVTVATGASGTYWVHVAPGEYAVRFEATGFARQEVPLVEVRLGRTVTLSAVLAGRQRDRTSRGDSRERAPG